MKALTLIGSETRLLAAAKAGDPHAYEQAIRPHLSMLFAYSRAICGDYHAAEDVVQETAQIAYRKINYFIPEADFAGWLRAIARRQALAARRKIDRTTLVADGVLEEVYAEPSHGTGDSRGEVLSECIKKLPGRAASAVHAHYFQGMRMNELADQLDTSPPAIRQLLHRARLILLDCVRRRTGTETAS